MKSRQKPSLSMDEQTVLDRLTVRLIQPDEQARFDQYLIKEHYLHNARIAGQNLRYVAEFDGQWLALLTWSAPAFRLKARDAWIGWSEVQRQRRLSLVVNNSRFLILPHAHYPNLASRVMKLCLHRLSQDWQERWGHPLLLGESFVDGQLFRGTSYKVSAWQELGLTKGYGRNREDFYVKHDRPKQLWVRELRAGARELLKARALPPAYAVVEQNSVPPCETPVKELEQMRLFFGSVRDWRKKVGDFNCAGLAALIVCASLCGVVRGQRDLGAFARTLSAAQLKGLGFRKTGRPRRYHPPSESTFQRFLSAVDSATLEQALLAWQEARLGARTKDDEVVALDGKELLSSQGVETVSAYAVKSGRWLGSELVEEKSNEIPAAQELLRRIDLVEGDKVLLDAIHTQQQTGHIIVQERGADYLLTVKGNQPGIEKTLETARANRRGFSPSG